MLELNKIYNMDCLDGLRQLESSSADCFITDPPYGMSFQSGYRQVKHKKIEGDDDLYWLSFLAYQMERILKPNTHAYVFCSHHNIELFLSEFRKRFTIKNVLVWQKNNTGMGDLSGDYAPKYEFIIYLNKGKRDLNGRRDSNILNFSRTDNELHPTQKPIDLIRFLIEKSTNKGDLVIDPFLGSGTSAEACKQLSRNFIGFEVDEGYCKVAEDRLKQQILFS